MEKTCADERLELLEAALREEEKSEATREKYRRDVLAFLRYVGDRPEITKDLVVAYKQRLAETYAITSANSMLAAVNYYLRLTGRSDCTVKAFKLQGEAFRREERELTKEEYFRLLEAARRKRDTRLYLLMETICATGIRVSELRFITVQALRSRQAAVSLKGKTRTVLLPGQLCRELLRYARDRGIKSGSVFVTRSGRPMDRNNILHAMKALCRLARVAASKVFPHNLRHLFAVTYYQAERDICHLADLLGHSSINTTRIYTSVSQAEQRHNIERLGLLSIKYTA